MNSKMQALSKAVDDAYNALQVARAQVNDYRLRCAHTWSREYFPAPLEEFRIGHKMFKFTCQHCGEQEITR